jgi:hypothetical protein
VGEGCGASGARCWGGVGGLALKGRLWECEGFLRAGGAKRAMGSGGL